MVNESGEQSSNSILAEKCLFNYEPNLKLDNAINFRGYMDDI